MLNDTGLFILQMVCAAFLAVIAVAVIMQLVAMLIKWWINK